MAANSNSEKELFLDILTKEEREALLSRKMEEIRKKNELLRKRHQEVEADKRKAESKKTSTENHVGQSPRNESNSFPSEERRKTSGRGKQLAKMSQEKLKAQDINIVVVNEKSSNKQSKRENRSATMIKERPGQFHDSEREAAMMSRERPQYNHDTRERGAPFKERQPYNHDYQRETAIPARERSARHHDYDRERPKKHSHDNRNRYSRDFDEKDNIGGPPPDPSYNFLADRRREGPGGGRGDYDNRERDKSRRHPKNFGGTDFDNVKDKIKYEKNRQTDRHAPPKSKMDMAMSMTGKERRQYTEWRSEREKVDRDRIERQKSSSGEWRRAWDADKIPQEYDEQSNPQRMEPAKRPAGRGQGVIQHQERVVQHQEQQMQMHTQQHVQHAQPVKKPAGRGRGRGRGRGSSDKEQRPQRARSFSDETRTVERHEDLLVIKVDNSPGQNGSVEVGYSDDNDTLKRKSRSPKLTVTSAVQTPPGECWEDEIQVVEVEKPGNSGHTHQKKDGDILKQNDGLEIEKRSHSTSIGDHDDSWEDCTEDSSEFYGTTTGESEDGLPIDHSEIDDVQPGVVKEITTATNSDKFKEALKVDCTLNPDAPEFTPLSPEMMKTPPGHEKVESWSTVARSPTSPIISPTYQVKKDLIKSDSPKRLDEVIEESIPDAVVNNDCPSSSGDGVPTGTPNSSDGGVNNEQSSLKSRANDDKHCSTDSNDDDDEIMNNSDNEETVEVQQVLNSQSSAVEICAPEYSQNYTEELEDSDYDLEEEEGLVDRERSQERQMVSNSDEISDDVTIQSSNEVETPNDIESDNYESDEADNDVSDIPQKDMSDKIVEDVSDKQTELSGDDKEVDSKTEEDNQSSEVNQACTHSESEGKDIAETSNGECISEVVSES